MNIKQELDKVTVNILADDPQIAIDLVNRQELAALIASELRCAGFRVRFVCNGTKVLTDAKTRMARDVLETVEYPSHLITWNTSYKSENGQFMTMIKTW